MLATVPSCELDVERGPDWLLVRVTNLDEVNRTSLNLQNGYGACCNSTSPIAWCWNSIKSAC